MQNGSLERHNFEFVELPFPSSDVVFTPVDKMSGDNPRRLLQNVTSLQFPHWDLHLLIHGSSYLRDGERSVFILNNRAFLHFFDSVVFFRRENPYRRSERVKEIELINYVSEAYCLVLKAIFLH